MLAELIRDIVCKIVHCSLVQCEVGSIPVFSRKSDEEKQVSSFDIRVDTPGTLRLDDYN